MLNTRRRRLHPFLHRRGRVLYFFWTTPDGKRREESLRTHDPNIARARYQLRLQEIEARLAPENTAKATLEQTAHKWLQHRSLRVARGTLHAETSIVRTLARELGPGTRLEVVADVERIHRYQDVRLRAGISPKTVNNEIQVLRLILQSAELWQRVQPRYRPLRNQRSDIAEALTPEQCTRLVTVAAQAELFAVASYAAVLALDTGMRNGEIKQLTLGDLHHDAPRPYLIVRRATTKTDAGARRVALGQLAAWAVRKLAARAGELGAHASTDYLLPTDRARHTRASDPLRGTGYDPAHAQSSWEAEWRQLRKQVGIEHRRFHDLRHTYITRAAEAGVPIAVAQAQVGHLSRAMTDHYTHVGQQAQFEAAGQIERHRPELLACIGVKSRGGAQLACEKSGSEIPPHLDESPGRDDSEGGRVQ